MGKKIIVIYKKIIIFVYLCKKYLMDYNIIKVIYVIYKKRWKNI